MFVWVKCNSSASLSVDSTRSISQQCLQCGVDLFQSLFLKIGQNAFMHNESRVWTWWTFYLADNMHSSQLNLVTLAEANNRWIWWKLCWCCQSSMASHKGGCDSRRQPPDEARHQRIHKSSAGPLHPLQIDWQNTSREYSVIQTVLTTKQVQKSSEFCYPLEWLEHHSAWRWYLWDNLDIDPPKVERIEVASPLIPLWNHPNSESCNFVIWDSIDHFLESLHINSIQGGIVPS